MNALETPSFEAMEKLTDWAKPPSLAELKQDLQDARPIHSSQETKIGGWLDNLNITGSAVIKPEPGNSKVVPKLIRKQAEWRYAALSEPFLSTDDVFKVNPVTWEDRKAAQQNQLVLNHQFNTKINKVTFIDTYVRTLVDEGTAIVRVSWEFQDEAYEMEEPIVRFVEDAAFAPMIQELEAYKVSSPSEYELDVPPELKQAHALSLQEGVPLRPEILGTELVTKRRTIKNCPTLEVCDYHNVVVDPTCMGDIDKANFVVYSYESSKSQLEKEGKYKNLEHINITGNSPLNEPDHAASAGVSNFNFNDQARKKIVVHEYWGFWDINGTGIVEPIVATWVGNTMIRLEMNPYPDKKIPFVIVQYLPVRRSNYGEPDGVLIEDNQKIAGAISRGMIDIMAKSANGQTGVRKDFLDATNRKKYDAGKDYEFNQVVDPRVGVYMHTYPEIPQSAAMMLQLQNMEAESLTGVKSFSQGVSGNALGDVAAGVRGALDAASKRELGILRRISAGIVEIGRKIISMNSEFLEPQEVIRVTNEEFVQIRRDDLAGAFDLKLSITTAEEDDKKAQELAFMLQTMGNNLDGDMTRMILSDIARLRKMPELSEKIENFQPQPDPVAQKMQELEIAKIEAEIAETRAKTQKIMADAGLSAQKIDTEAAKAGHLRSDTDKLNLDYVEQESGVTQERELQQHGAQAQANAQLKLLDHYLKSKEKKTGATSK